MTNDVGVREEKVFQGIFGGWMSACATEAGCAIEEYQEGVPRWRVIFNDGDRDAHGLGKIVTIAPLIVEFA